MSEVPSSATSARLAFEAVIIADYDAQSAVKRELVLRLASLLWRLRRGTSMETGLFEIQADYLMLGQPDPSFDRVLHDDGTNITEAAAKPSTDDHTVDPRADLTHCFLRLANLPNFALDRLNRYEAILWRQASQIVYALDTLDRRKPQERLRRRYGFEEAKE